MGTLNVTRFVLKPGKAGTQYSDYGGGGGGILVSGETSPFSEHMGEGFGGGGYKNVAGSPGCVLVEVSILRFLPDAKTAVSPFLL